MVDLNRIGAFKIPGRQASYSQQVGDGRMMKPKTRTTLGRIPTRGSHEAQTIRTILDDAFLAHVAFQVDSQPFVIPTLYGREEDKLYLHGSAASRMLRELEMGVPVCVCVTIVDGLVLARSAFHHSMNYRSVVAFGIARKIQDAEKKTRALRIISEHLLPDRWNDVRGPSQRELKATTVLEFHIEEASAKIRTGPPVDEEEDYGLPVWAGVVPLRQVASSPMADARLADGIHVPDYVLRKL
jgi:nitroimidazol reductase NimA-like FMN-containing flavoprotein (pyridoxamine 5'-phosphate oxidase superfamily)